MSKNFAIISGDKVINVIVADSKKRAQEAFNGEILECDGSFWIGWNRVEGEWIAPTILEVIDEA